MLFTSTVFASLLSLAAASPVEKRWPADDGSSLRPQAISIYHSQNGAIDVNVPKGQVSRQYWDGKDLSTLVTFDLNARAPPAGATCSFKFVLDGADAATKASGYIDIFRSLQPAPTSSASSWGPGNQRDTNLGRFKPVKDGNAVVITNVGPNQLNGFPCPQTTDSNVKNGRVGYEIAPAGDVVDVQWSASLSGLYLDW